MFNIADARHLVNIASVKLGGKTLTFNVPDPERWEKSTVCLNTKVPLGKTTEDVAKHFEKESIWGRRLDVKQVMEDIFSGSIYITFSNQRGKDQAFLISRKIPNYGNNCNEFSTGDFLQNSSW